MLFLTAVDPFGIYDLLIEFWKKYFGAVLGKGRQAGKKCKPIKFSLVLSFNYLCSAQIELLKHGTFISAVPKRSIHVPNAFHEMIIHILSFCWWLLSNSILKGQKTIIHMLDLPLPEHSLGGVLLFLATVCCIYELDKFDSDKLAFVLYQILARHIFLNLHPHGMTADTFF